MRSALRRSISSFCSRNWSKFFWSSWSCDSSWSRSSKAFVNLSVFSVRSALRRSISSSFATCRWVNSVWILSVRTSASVFLILRSLIMLSSLDISSSCSDCSSNAALASDSSVSSSAILSFKLLASSHACSRVDFSSSRSVTAFLRSSFSTRSCSMNALSDSVLLSNSAVKCFLTASASHNWAFRFSICDISLAASALSVCLCIWALFISSLVTVTCFS